MISRRTLALLLMLGAAANVTALLPSHSPFLDGQSPPPFPITVYRRLDLPFEGTIRFTRIDGSASPLTITEHEFGFRLAVGATPAGPDFSIVPPGIMVGGLSAGESDLNGDGHPDFIVITHSGGNGLAAQVSWVTVILSSEKGYHGQVLAAYDASLADLVDIDHDGRPEYIHQFFVSGVAGKDGIAHSYWVFNLVGFDSAGLVPTNARSPGFPRWVWFSNRPNHEPTDQLTAEQKRQSWIRTTSLDRENWFDSDFSFLRQLTPLP